MDKTVKIACIKRSESFRYLVVGGGTTLINIVFLFGLTHIAVPWALANMLAWFASVLFAFITNKIVFADAAMAAPKVVVKEGLRFFALRGASLLVNTAILFTTGMTLMHGSHVAVGSTNNLKPVNIV